MRSFTIRCSMSLFNKKPLQSLDFLLFPLSKFQYSRDPLLMLLVSRELIGNIVRQVLYIGRIKWLFRPVRRTMIWQIEPIILFMMPSFQLILIFCLPHILSFLVILIRLNFLRCTMSFFLFLKCSGLLTWALIDLALIVSTILMLRLLLHHGVKLFHFLGDIWSHDFLWLFTV